MAGRGTTAHRVPTHTCEHSGSTNNTHPSLSGCMPWPIGSPHCICTRESQFGKVAGCVPPSSGTTAPQTWGFAWPATPAAWAPQPLPALRPVVTSAMFALQAAVPIVSKPASANALLVSPSVAAGPSGPASWPPSDEEESHSGTTSCASSSIATSTSSLNATPTSGNYDTPSLMNAGDGTKRHVPAPALAIAAATATATTSPTCTAPNPVATASLAAAALAQRVVYADSSYWDGRYAHRPVVHFDWFFSYKALRNLLQHAITQPTLPVLHVGCGNSDLSNGLAEDGIPVRRG